VGIGTVKLAIFDRDGTIVESCRDAQGAITSAFSPAELRLLPGVVEGMALLRDAGYTLAIATNQPGYAKGQTTRDAIERTNAALVTMLDERSITIAHVEVCLHHPVGGPGGDATLVGPCECRKPRPGMLLALLARFNASPAQAWMIGDSVVDAEAGRAASVRTALVGAQNPDVPSDFRGASVTLIAEEILRRG
jgi:D-glycero-D-manno-heptose 1,7-bisphosphate phosphatase